MRAALLGLLLLAAATPPAEADSCEFANSAVVGVPASAYFVVVERSYCSTSTTTFHKESVAITERHPNDPTHELVAMILYVSQETLRPDGSRVLLDAMSVQQGDARVTASYQGTTDRFGAPTCEAGLAYNDPPSSFAVGTEKLPACPPQSLLLI